MSDIKYAEVVTILPQGIKVKFPYETEAGNAVYPYIKSYIPFVGDTAALIKTDKGYLAIGGMKNAE